MSKVNGNYANPEKFHLGEFNHAAGGSIMRDYIEIKKCTQKNKEEEKQEDNNESDADNFGDEE